LARNDRTPDAVLVVGLGKFGRATATALARLGHEVLAVDADARLVQEWSGHLTHVIEADATNVDAMRQIGADEFAVAVVAIGNDIEASILSTLVLEDLAVQQIWAKAITAAHGRILERIGADHVVYPEREMGERVAHLLTGKMIEFIEFEDDFAIAKTHAPREAHGRTLGEVKLRSRYGITVVGVKSRGADFVPAMPHTLVNPGDLLIVSGPTQLIEKFSAIT
jgi:trk system potassium uptake protein TrkA